MNKKPFTINQVGGGVEGAHLVVVPITARIVVINLTSERDVVRQIPLESPPRPGFLYGFVVVEHVVICRQSTAVDGDCAQVAAIVIGYFRPGDDARGCEGTAECDRDKRRAFV